MHRKPQILLHPPLKKQRSAPVARLHSAQPFASRLYIPIFQSLMSRCPPCAASARVRTSRTWRRSRFFSLQQSGSINGIIVLSFMVNGGQKNAFYVPNITEKIGRTSTTAVRKCVHRKYLVSAVHWRKHRLLMALSKLRYRKSFEYGSRISRAERTPG
jgi:hypothetical protein